MCVKFSPKDLIPNSCSPHSTNTYTCEMIIAPIVCDKLKFKKKINVTIILDMKKI